MGGKRPMATELGICYVPNRCASCDDTARLTRFQERRNPDSDLCETCFIDACEHPGETGVTPQRGLEYCFRCGQVVG